jgi:pimeloyl-ACP methyl ester carboxylesterase
MSVAKQIVQVADRLRTIVSHNLSSTAAKAETVVVYVHGFPDSAVAPDCAEFASRMPRKLCEACNKQMGTTHPFAFVTFNGAGFPGSYGAFRTKSLVDDLDDVHSVLQYTREQLLAPEGRLFLVGLSTGAFLAFLYACQDRARALRLSGVVPIACIDSLRTGVNLDFDAEQVEQFQRDGYAMVQSIDGQLHELDRRYYDSFFELRDLKDGAVDLACPCLLIHGTKDPCVPYDMAQSLEAHVKGIADQQIRLLTVEQANHLFTASQHMDKLCRAVMELVSTGQLSNVK